MGPAAAWPWGCLLVATSRSNRALPQWPVLLPKMWHCRGTATPPPTISRLDDFNRVGAMAIVQKLLHMELSFQEKERSNLWEKKRRKYWGRQLTLPSMFYLPVLMNQYPLELWTILLKTSHVLFFQQCVSAHNWCHLSCYFNFYKHFIWNGQRRKTSGSFFGEGFIVSRLKLQRIKITSAGFCHY